MAKYRGANKYIGAWHYTFLNLLYCIPGIGWIVAIIHANDKGNENRCHFARSFFTRLLLLLIILLIAAAVAYFVIGGDEVNRIFGELPDAWKDFTSIFEKPVG